MTNRLDSHDRMATAPPPRLAAPSGDCCAAREILRIREGELQDLKGPCRNSSCRLHYAHSGPCDGRRAT